MIRVHTLQDPVDLVLAILATGREAARDVHEDGQAALAAGGNRFEVSVPEERGELRRTGEGRMSFPLGRCIRATIPACFRE